MQNLNRILALGLIALCAVATVVGLIRPLDDRPTTMQGSNPLPIGDRLLVLTLEGAISSGRNTSPFGGGGSDALTIRDQILEAAKDTNIKGVLLRIDSPGGTVGTSQEVYNALLALREKKPVVVSMGDVAASGGYYIACAANQIYANPGTLTGSIGVIISGYSAAKLLNIVGVAPQVIKSGKFKDILSLNRALTPEERSLLQALIQDSYEQFLQAVAQGRKMDIAKIRPLADGRIYTGRQAKALGLVDVLGGQVEAQQALQKLAKERFNLQQDLPFNGGGNSVQDLLRRALTTNQVEIVTSPLPFEKASLQPLWLAPGLTR